MNYNEFQNTVPNGFKLVKTNIGKFAASVADKSVLIWKDSDFDGSFSWVENNGFKSKMVNKKVIELACACKYFVF